MGHTFTAMTYNLWGGWDLDRRRPALESLLRRRSPDLLGVQELHPRLRESIDTALPHHARVHDEHPGWAERGNLWWDARCFEYVAHGVTDIGLRSEHAGLFWVRLANRCAPELPELTLSTVHLTWPGHPEEVATNCSPRTSQAATAAAELDRLAGSAPVLMCADMNDHARPMWAMYDSGFREPFGVLGRTCPPTHPVTPRADKPARWEGVQTVEKALDWVFFRGPIVPRTAEVVEYFDEGAAPSDHKAVMATFTTRAE